MGKFTVYFDISIGSKAGSRLVFELFNDITPKAAENFRGLCTGEYGVSGRTGKPLHYLGTSFFRVVEGVLIQGGDIQNDDGTGGECVWGGSFRDENFVRRHAQAGCLAMANNGRHTNGSQFYITLRKASALDGKHVVVGQLVEGMEVLRAMQLVPVDPKTGKPRVPIVISGCGELGVATRRLNALHTTRTQLNEMMDRHVREQLKKQEDEHKLVDSESDASRSSSESSENETAEHRRKRERMKRKKQRYLKSALFKAEALLKQMQQEAAHDLKEKYAGLQVDEEDREEEEDEGHSSPQERAEPREAAGGDWRKKRKAQSGTAEDDAKARAAQSEAKAGAPKTGNEEIDVMLMDEEEESEGSEEGSEEDADNSARRSRILALRMKINEGRKLNNKEVLEEKRVWNDPVYEKRKAEGLVRSVLRQLHGEEDDSKTKGPEKKKGRSQDEEEDEDAEESRLRRGYMNDAAALIADKKLKEEKRGQKTFGWNVFNQDALYRAHKKRLTEVNFKEDEYRKQKEALGGVFYDPSSALVAADFKPTEAAKDRLVNSVENAQKRRRNFSRRRTFHEDDNVTYINERNRIYNEKIDRAFGASSLEIRQNLERGTAL
ncbi:putative cyclophilin [Besnoitia besnoiti]|uniref:peptidylprolyl isomerase n=1 Tax=Besnoitia besnoiti TaxID=94643 RepID=A0A2A9MAY7_BESBE|nr:putative cyclophilin [Besnoitia besnoiti]PFH33096.1 putative cyclophilin [Besnoitia besnoiti]